MANFIFSCGIDSAAQTVCCATLKLPFFCRVGKALKCHWRLQVQFLYKLGLIPFLLFSFLGWYQQLVSTLCVCTASVHLHCCLRTPGPSSQCYHLSWRLVGSCWPSKGWCLLPNKHSLTVPANSSQDCPICLLPKIPGKQHQTECIVWLASRIKLLLACEQRVSEISWVQKYIPRRFN